MYKQYISDGSGRDSYITFESGGFIKTIPKSPVFERKSTSFPRKFSPPFPKIDPRSVYYHSDGSGRDFYITFNNGGLTQAVQFGGKKDIFKESLRNDSFNLRMHRRADPRYRSSSQTGNQASLRLHPNS
jgi:hypothetical protein